ncbi:hypothetical protein [Sphingomonas sp.]|uniref:hypothetical protein n=1 Tax=Sphingomonas sp. TaxID=28214 RepID=UPI003752EA7E
MTRSIVEPARHVDVIHETEVLVVGSGPCDLAAVGDPYALMVTGRLLFGLGNETLYIALLVGLAQWFHAGGGALAIALFFSMARIGSYAADTSTSWAAATCARGWQPVFSGREGYQPGSGGAWGWRAM